MFEYKFVALETFILDEQKKEENEDYHGHIEIQEDAINLLGKENWELVQIVIIDGIQHGWFKKSKLF